MSKHFTNLQKVLRHVRETNNVDLTHTHGVTIDGKVYPALEKEVHIYPATSYYKKGEILDNHESYIANFAIPFESGMRAYFHLNDLGTMEANFNVPFIHTRLDDKTGYGYISAGLALNEETLEGNIPEHPSDYYADVGVTPRSHLTHNRRNPHEAIQKFSNLPSFGILDNNESYMAKLSEQGFSEHKNNYKIKPHHFPNTVVYTYSHPVDEHFKQFEYNVVTEQLKERPNV